MKDQKQPYEQANWNRRLVILLFVPLLVFSLGAAVTRSASHTTKPKLIKRAWLWTGNTYKGNMAALNSQVAELENQRRSLQAQILRTKTRAVRSNTRVVRSNTGITGSNTRIAESPSNSTDDNTFQAQSVEDQTTADSQPGAVQTDGQTETGVQDGLTSANLAKQTAALKETQSLLGQYKAASQQWQDATLGSEANYKALMEGRLKDSGGFYAQRAVLDETAKTEFVPAGPCGDYPANWCKAAPDSRIYFGDHAFLNRECVAYAAWKRWKNGQQFATGNAGDWPGNSARPTVGSVAIWNAGTVGRYGHVAYVTAVDKDSITVSEFNWHPFLHSNRVIKPGRGWPSRFWN